MLFKKLATSALLITAITACSDNNIKTEAETVSQSPEIQSQENQSVTTQTAASALASEEKPALFTNQSIMVTAHVEAIDQQSRVVTLMAEDGKTVTFTASEDARNLGQVAVGDIVHAEYIQSISLQVVAAENVEPLVAEVAAVVQSEQGEMPGLAALDTIVKVLTIEEINIENNTFKLKDADGVVSEYVARDPENLKKSAVGDALVASYTKAVAISVEKATAE
jgi:Cu/Ag efflux protein CusF